MGKRKGGYRRKTRILMRKNVREHGKIRLADYFATYKDGDKVALRAEPGYQGGIYHLRFHGKVGEIAGKQGDCYYVAIVDGGKAKKVLVHPIHLQRVGATKRHAVAEQARSAPKTAAKAPAAKPAAVTKAAAAVKPAAAKVAVKSAAVAPQRKL
jgi:large subunit ribosomal protein L21e